jgi:signal peptidase II
MPSIIKKSSLNYFGTSLIVLSFFILDRFFKNFFLLKPKDSFQFLFFKLFLYKNERIFFGLLPFNSFIFIFAFFVFFFLLCWLFSFWRQRNFFYFLASFLISTGAFSNFIDRIYYGFVIDYLVWPFNYFNLADLMILTGTLMVLIKLIFRKN